MNHRRLCHFWGRRKVSLVYHYQFRSIIGGFYYHCSLSLIYRFSLPTLFCLLCNDLLLRCALMLIPITSIIYSFYQSCYYAFQQLYHIKNNTSCSSSFCICCCRIISFCRFIHPSEIQINFNTTIKRWSYQRGLSITHWGYAAALFTPYIIFVT